jgi:hypothetical protein
MRRAAAEAIRHDPDWSYSNFTARASAQIQ